MKIGKPLRTHRVEPLKDPLHRESKPQPAEPMPARKRTVPA